MLLLGGRRAGGARRPWWHEKKLDDDTPHGSQEDNASEDAIVQDEREIDDASLHGSPDEPPDMLDDDEDEEIESLPVGIIPPDDDNDGGSALHRNHGDLEAVYSRYFLDSTQEALTMRHLATHKPKLRSCDACRRAKALKARHIRSLEKRKTGFMRPEDLHPKALETRSRWITSLPEMSGT
jgi:hypothetical protein